MNEKNINYQDFMKRVNKQVVINKGKEMVEAGVELGKKGLDYASENKEVTLGVLGVATLLLKRCGKTAGERDRIQKGLEWYDPSLHYKIPLRRALTAQEIGVVEYRHKALGERYVDILRDMRLTK